jgi:hypothetical protein
MTAGENQTQPQIMVVGDTHANPVSVTFDSEGSKLSGTLYIPPEHMPGTPVPGIIVTGS